MTKKILTQERLKELFEYEQYTGLLVRKIYRSPNAQAGDIVGCIQENKNGKKYFVVRINGFLYLLHRVIWLYMTGCFPVNTIDHKDGNGLNNKWDNLRDVTLAENHKNHRLQSNNITGVCGVSRNKQRGKWESYITVSGVKINLGHFEDEKDAIIVRKMAEYKYGFHKNHGTQREL